MKPYHLVFYLVLIICSCHRNGEGKHPFPDINSTSIIKHQPTTWQELLTEQKKNRDINGAFDISEDSVILFRGSFGIELSLDAGKTWTWLGQHIPHLNEFTIDDKGTWWGLEYWRGIHEPSYSRIHSSANAGKSWKTYDINTRTFMPYHIYSEVRHPLQLVDFESRKVLALPLNGNPVGNWHFAKQLPNHDNEIRDLSAANYFISRENNKLYVKRKDGIADTLVGFTKAHSIYQIEKYEDIIYVVGSDTSELDAYFAVIKQEKIFKEFIIPGVGANLTITPFGHIYLTSTKGAFQYKKNGITQIYK